MNASAFVSAVSQLSFEHAFNPYSDRCAIYDRADAPRMRSSALAAMLDCASSGPVDAIWVGRDLGYRGGRRTGLALTDEVHAYLHLKRWGISGDRPTIGNIVAERTAAVIWDVLTQIDASIFLWNVFPLHPHEPDRPFTNRTHNARERHTGEQILAMLVELLRPRRIIAIGNDASSAAARVSAGFPIISVRHPSYGGQTQFMRQIRDAYGLPGLPQMSTQLLI